MASNLCGINQRISFNTWRYLLTLVLWFHSIHSQILFQSRMIFLNTGTQFSPANMPGQLISTRSASSLKMCAFACNMDVLCRIFDFGVNNPQQCRLFEGDVTTMGTIVTSSSFNSTVGIIQLSTELFTGYGRPCSSLCDQTRYLICGSNSTCQCVPHTYWNESMCVPQIPIIGASCQQNISMCRQDLNYTCLRQLKQCGPLSVFAGVTIADHTTVIAGSSTVGLSLPQEIIIDALVPDSILVADGVKSQVVRLSDGSSNNSNNSVVARNWTGGNLLLHPYSMFLDVNRGNNLYVSDSGANRVVLFTDIQSVSPPPRIIAGAGGPVLNTPCGIAIDGQGNMIIVDHGNHRVLLYAPNSTNGSVIAGTGSAGNDSLGLNNPSSSFLDERNSWLYVADVYNHRIQRFSLNSSSRPLQGTTVAGGNGAGVGSHQLNMPYGIWVSNKTGVIYIADTSNHRIQRWNPGATTGVTIAGDPSGTSGNNATMLNNPYRLTASANESFLYVSDGSNNRVQRFQLI